MNSKCYHSSNNDLFSRQSHKRRHNVGVFFFSPKHCIYKRKHRFVSADLAASDKLAYVDPGTNRAIIKVDNTSTVPFNEKRNTVRIATKDRYAVGSVWVADMFHLPYGVGYHFLHRTKRILTTSFRSAQFGLLGRLGSHIYSYPV